MAKKKNALSHTKWIIRESLSTITMLPFIIMVQITLYNNKVLVYNANYKKGQRKKRVRWIR